MIVPMKSATSRRLFVSFGFLLLLLAAASYFAIAGSTELHEALHRVKHAEEAVRLSFELGDAVRAARAHGGRDGRIDETRRELDEHVDSVEGHAVVAGIVAAQTPDEAMARAHAAAIRFESDVGDFEAHGGTVQHSTFLWTLILLGAAIVFAVAVALFIARSVARPLSRLHAGTERLGSGDLSARIEVDSADEFGRLALAFNQMASALHEHQLRLVQHETLAGIGRVVAGVAHELNNPLSVILGYLRILHRSADSALAQDLKIIEEEAVRCQRIVEDLLDLARPRTLEPAVVYVRQSCADVVGRLLRAEQWRRVRVDIRGDAVTRADRARFEQVITNLVRNAIDAAGPDGAVEIEIQTLGDFIDVVVHDSGPGIDPAVRAHLFEPFFTTKQGGTGLGLAVCQAIARSHHGEIRVGDGAGRGASFTFRLPHRVDS